MYMYQIYINGCIKFTSCTRSQHDMLAQCSSDLIIVVLGNNIIHSISNILRALKFSNSPEIILCIYPPPSGICISRMIFTSSKGYRWHWKGSTLCSVGLFKRLVTELWWSTRPSTIAISEHTKGSCKLMLYV